MIFFWYSSYVFKISYSSLWKMTAAVTTSERFWHSSSDMSLALHRGHRIQLFELFQFTCLDVYPAITGRVTSKQIIKHFSHFLFTSSLSLGPHAWALNFYWTWFFLQLKSSTSWLALPWRSASYITLQLDIHMRCFLRLLLITSLLYRK